MKPAVVAVLDVGKTNKKLSVYDRQFQVLGEERTTLETDTRDGLEIEPTDDLLAWFRASIKRLAREFDIRAVSITAHGATYAMLGEDGAPAYPVISYTSEKGAEVQEEFYDTFGDRRTLHRNTCTPDLGFANLGKSIFYVNTRMPQVWKKVRHLLFYDSYLGYELTGVRSMEPTYLGNHSYLWDFFDGRWSEVGFKLGAPTRFPDRLSNPWDRLGAVKPELARECGLSPDCVVTMGLHDSNANFLPYLAQGFENFVLNSSGTWCVLMSQADSPVLTDAELDAKVFHNLDVYNRPLKTAVFPAGLEYEKFSALSGLKDDSDTTLVEQVAAARDLFIVPGVLPDAGAYPGVPAKVVHGGGVSLYHEAEAKGGAPFAALGREYFGALNLSLALATRQLLNRCGARQGTTVFIEGGFSKNRPYCEALAALCPDYTIALTNQKEGTSFGAALTGWMLLDDATVQDLGRDFEIQTSAIAARPAGALEDYWQAYQAHLKA